MKITIWVAQQSEPGSDRKTYAATTDGRPPADVDPTPHIDAVTGEHTGLADVESFYGDWQCVGEVDGVLDVSAYGEQLVTLDGAETLEVGALGRVLETIEQDARYSVGLEYYGARSPSFIARFCGEWIGAYPAWAAAWAACSEHRQQMRGEKS